MKILVTQVGTYVTGDAVADAVMEYWLALTEERRADVVDIPTVGSDGRESLVRVTLGAALPMAVLDADMTHGLDDAGAAEHVRVRLRSLNPPARAAFDLDEVPDAHSDYDGFLA